MLIATSFGRAYSGIALLLLTNLIFSAECNAQSAPPGVDIRYESILKQKDRNMSTPGNEFGDQVSKENGALSFDVVDVSLPGNNSLPVEFRRTVSTNRTFSPTSQGSSPIPDWKLGLPRIDAAYEAAGWLSTDTSRATKNCSISSKNFISPPAPQGHPDFPIELIWSPAAVTFPGQGQQPLIYNDGKMPSPATGGPYYWLTASMDYASCIPALKNAGTTSAEQKYGRYEGFLIMRADGTKYWFDWIARGLMVTVGGTEPNFDVTSPYKVISFSLFQDNLELYPTRVEDRFGNWVEYTYSNKNYEAVKLDRIESSDGRVITVGYDADANGKPRISSVSANGRHWTYAYTDGFTVTNPDGSRWRYTGYFYSTPPDLPLGHPLGPCAQPSSWMSKQNPDFISNPVTGGIPDITVESPSGAKAEFYLATVLLGHSHGHAGCFARGYTVGTGGGAASVTDFHVPLGYYTSALVAKRVTGPGLPDMWWRYTYQSVINMNADPGGTTSKELAPDGTLTTYLFGNAQAIDDGLLIRKDVSRSGVLFDSEQYVYITSSSSGFPKAIGFHPQLNADMPLYTSGYLRPKVSQVVTQGGYQFRWDVAKTCSGGAAFCVDPLGRPLVVDKRSVESP